MNDQFLVKFALATLVTISFGLQHASQVIVRRMNPKDSNDKTAGWIITTLIIQLLSISIIVEIIRYALTK